MICFSVPIRTIDNVFVENKTCNECFKLQVIAIGYLEHLIVNDENIVMFDIFNKIGDFIFAYNLTYDELDLASNLGRLIILGENHLNCSGMTIM